MFGVRMSVAPLNPTSFQPRSSATMWTMLGLRAAGGAGTGATAPMSRSAADSAPRQKKKGPGTGPGPSRIIPGDVLLSHAVYREVPSGLEGLTAVFGMGTGVAPPLRSPGNSISL